MREILFRGKSISNSKWVYGSLIKTGDFCCILPDDDGSMWDYPYMDSDLGIIDGSAIPVEPTTVGQFINTWDRNGNKMFEGDLVNVYDRKGDAIDQIRCEALIIADSSCLINMDGFGRWFPQDTIRVEVFGNIYDNSDRLSEKAKRWLNNYYYPDYEGEPYGKWS
jgi:uncharacterized phage protein (TIGR01671 family)